MSGGVSGEFWRSGAAAQPEVRTTDSQRSRAIIRRSFFMLPVRGIRITCGAAKGGRPAWSAPPCQHRRSLRRPDGTADPEECNGGFSRRRLEGRDPKPFPRPTPPGPRPPGRFRTLALADRRTAARPNRADAHVIRVEAARPPPLPCRSAAPPPIRFPLKLSGAGNGDRPRGRGPGRAPGGRPGSRCCAGRSSAEAARLCGIAARSAKHP
jgi:hypothetical protein